MVLSRPIPSRSRSGARQEDAAGSRGRIVLKARHNQRAEPAKDAGNHSHRPEGRGALSLRQAVSRSPRRSKGDAATARKSRDTTQADARGENGRDNGRGHRTSEKGVDAFDDSKVRDSSNGGRRGCHRRSRSMHGDREKLGVDESPLRRGFKPGADESPLRREFKSGADESPLRRGPARVRTDDRLEKDGREEPRVSRTGDVASGRPRRTSPRKENRDRAAAAPRRAEKPSPEPPPRNQPQETRQTDRSDAQAKRRRRRVPKRSLGDADEKPAAKEKAITGRCSRRKRDDCAEQPERRENAEPVGGRAKSIEDPQPKVATVENNVTATRRKAPPARPPVLAEPPAAAKAPELRSMTPEPVRKAPEPVRKAPAARKKLRSPSISTKSEESCGESIALASPTREGDAADKPAISPGVVDGKNRDAQDKRASDGEEDEDKRAYDGEEDEEPAVHAEKRDEPASLGVDQQRSVKDGQSQHLESQDGGDSGSDADNHADQPAQRQPDTKQQQQPRLQASPARPAASAAAAGTNQDEESYSGYYSDTEDAAQDGARNSIPNASAAASSSKAMKAFDSVLVEAKEVVQAQTLVKKEPKVDKAQSKVNTEAKESKSEASSSSSSSSSSSPAAAEESSKKKSGGRSGTAAPLAADKGNSGRAKAGDVKLVMRRPPGVLDGPQVIEAPMASDRRTRHRDRPYGDGGTSSAAVGAAAAAVAPPAGFHGQPPGFPPAQPWGAMQVPPQWPQLGGGYPQPAAWAPRAPMPPPWAMPPMWGVPPPMGLMHPPLPGIAAPIHR